MWNLFLSGDRTNFSHHCWYGLLFLLLLFKKNVIFCFVRCSTRRKTSRCRRRWGFLFLSISSYSLFRDPLCKNICCGVRIRPVGSGGAGGAFAPPPIILKFNCSQHGPWSSFCSLTMVAPPPIIVPKLQRWLQYCHIDWKNAQQGIIGRAPMRLWAVWINGAI